MTTNPNSTSSVIEINNNLAPETVNQSNNASIEPPENTMTAVPETQTPSSNPQPQEGSSAMGTTQTVETQPSNVNLSNQEGGRVANTRVIPEIKHECTVRATGTFSPDSNSLKSAKSYFSTKMPKDAEKAAKILKAPKDIKYIVKFNSDGNTLSIELSGKDGTTQDELSNTLVKIWKALIDTDCLGATFGKVFETDATIQFGAQTAA